MVQALVFGALASSALVLGGFLGARWRAPSQFTGVLLAFASGTLIAALSFELFPEAVELGGLLRSGLGLLAGAAVFVVINTWLDRKAAPVAAGGEHKAEQYKVVSESSQRAQRDATVGMLLLASVTLDGIPENFALGVSLQSEASLTLLVAIFTSNFPEALVGSMAMRSGGKGPVFATMIWFLAAALLTLVVVVAHAAGSVPLAWLAFMMAFAGGAVLASLADTLMPEAFERGRPLNAFATAAGFFLSFYLSGA